MVGDFLQQKREKKKFDYERFVMCSKPLRFLNQNLLVVFLVCTEVYTRCKFSHIWSYWLDQVYGTTR